MNTSTRNLPAHTTPLSKNGSAPLIFLTVCTKNKQPILANALALNILTTIWETATSWLVGKFVLMPDHLHLFCAPTRDSEILESWVRFWKRQFTITWRDAGPCVREKSPWQKSFWDTQMRSQTHYAAQWEYVEQNPVRAKFVKNPEDWKYRGEIHRLEF